VPLTTNAIETFISTKITDLTECNIGNINDEYPKAHNWLISFVGSLIFEGHIQEADRHFLIQLIRKVEMSFDEYHLARETLEEFVQGGNNK